MGDPDVEEVVVNPAPVAPAPKDRRALLAGVAGSLSKLIEQNPDAVPAKVAALPCQDPCYLYKMVVETSHDSPPEKAPKTPPDEAALQQQIAQLQSDAKRLADDGSPEALRDLATVQAELLETYFSLNRPHPAASEASKPSVRTFTVVATIPPEVAAGVAASEQILIGLRQQLARKLSRWNEVHDDHEIAKRELATYDKTVADAQSILNKRNADVALIDKRLGTQEEHIDFAHRDGDLTATDIELLKLPAKVDELKEPLERNKAVLDQRDMWGARIDRNALREVIAQQEAELAEVSALLDDPGIKARRELLTKFKNVANDPASNFVTRKVAATKREKLLKKLYGDLEESQQAKLAAQRQAAAAKADAQLAVVTGLTPKLDALKNREGALRQQLLVVDTEARALQEAIAAEEEARIALRNVLKSGDADPIEVVAGTKVRRFANASINESIEKPGVNEAAAVIEDPVTVKVSIPADNTLANLGSLGPSPVVFCGTHPALSVWCENPAEEIIVQQKAAAAKSFKVQQAVQFDDNLVNIPGVRTVWNRLLRTLRIVKEVFGFTSEPRIREYKLWAITCGRKMKDRSADRLSKKLRVFPSDRFAVTITTKALMSRGVSREETWKDTTSVASEGNAVQSENDASGREHAVTVTYSETNLFGMAEKSRSVTRLDAALLLNADSTLDQPGRDLTIVTTSERTGSDQKVSTTFDGTRTDRDGTATVHESVSVHSTLDATGNAASNDVGLSTTQDGGVKTGLVLGTPAGYRTPVFPSSFFPMCPVDISFTRNGNEDELTQDIKQVVAIIVFLVRQVAACVTRLNNWVPALGWKVGFSCDILTGKFSLGKQYVEHIDRRVYRFYEADIDIEIVKISVIIFGGAWFELLFLEFKAGVDITIDGRVGIQAHLESRHPDAIAGQMPKVGFGPTGGIGATAQIRIVIGCADWCETKAGLSTGLDVKSMFWINHEEGPHLDLEVTFQGVAALVTAHLILVGSWQFKRTFIKERDVWKGKILRDAPDDNLFVDQNRNMDAWTDEMLAEGWERNQVSTKRRKRKLRAIRS